MKTPQSCALLHAQDIYHPGKNRLVSFSAAVPLIVFSILLFSGVESSATSFDDSALRDSTLIRVTRYSGMIGFFGQFAGPEYVAANVNIFLLPGLSLNAGGGLGAHIGANIYVAKKPGSIRLCPYLGLQRVSVFEISLLSDSDRRQAGWYFPVGLEYIAKKNRFSMQFEVGPNLMHTDYGQYNTKGLLAAFRIGGYFGRRRK